MIHAYPAKLINYVQHYTSVCMLLERKIFFREISRAGGLVSVVIQQACAAIMAAIVRNDPDELREMWRFMATAAACHWAGVTSGVSSSTARRSP